MTIALNTMLKSKVHSLFFVFICLVLGAVALAALNLTWELQAISDKDLQHQSSLVLSPSRP